MRVPLRILVRVAGRIALLALLSALAACASRPERAGNPRTRVVLLGTGTPNAEPDRWGPALAVVVDSTALLVDAGPGVVRRAGAAAERGIAALEPARLERLFLTHLHSDHTLGLPDLIFTPWVLGRERPLRIWGPPGTRAMVEHILAAWEEDVRIRVEGLEPANATGWRVEVTEIGPGVVYSEGGVRILAFEVHHGDWKHAFGYRIETPDRVVVVSGDTTPSPTLVEVARGCDILVHEVYSQAGFLRRPEEWRRYHADAHTSSIELAEIARQVRPGLLVVTHQLLWGSSPQELLAEITSRWKGRVVYGRDLDVF